MIKEQQREGDSEGKERRGGGDGGGVCMLLKKSAGTDLELAAGSHKHKSTQMSFIVFLYAVNGISFSPSLPVDFNINALYLLIVCPFWVISDMVTGIICSIFVLNISALYCT